LRKGDAVKRSSDRHQRDTDKQDERAKNAGTGEDEIDQALADSFPASDAPPWTLGVRSALQKGIGKGKRERD
jgi:hypothetical protein